MPRNYDFPVSCYPFPVGYRSSDDLKTRNREPETGIFDATNPVMRTSAGILFFLALFFIPQQYYAQPLPAKFAPLVAGHTAEQQVLIVDSIGASYRKSDPHLATLLLKVAIRISAEHQLDSLNIFERVSLNRLYRFRSENDSALAQLDTGLVLARSIGREDWEVELMAHRGVALTRLTNYDSASACYIKAISIAQRLKDTAMVGRLQQQWGLVYFYMVDFNAAIEHTQEALAIFVELRDTANIAANLDNIGLYYSNLKQYDSAFSYHLRSLPLFEELGDSTQLLICYNNLGSTLTRNGQFEPAEIYLTKGLEIARILKDQYREVTVLQSLGQLYDSARNEVKLLEVALPGYEMAVQLNNNFYAQSFAELLADSYYRQQQFEPAAKFYKISNQLRQVIYDEDIAAAAAEASRKYQTAERKKQIELLEADNVARTAQNERDSLIKWIIGGVVIVLLIFSAFVVRNYYRKKRHNQLLQDQNEAIEQQKAEIEVKNEEITDSISYAKRIQNAVLPTSERLNALFPQNFIYYRPRDIISGDFYWAAEGRNGMRFLAVADCTGHGVPGAMMSMLGTSILNRLIARKNITGPGKMLDALHEELLTTLNATSDSRQVSDGMDIALLMFDPEQKRVVVASADRPVFYVKSGALEVLAPDKISIGSSLPKNAPYTEHVLEAGDGLSIFLFSDGITDQFGGWDRKKFMTKRLKELVTSSVAMPLEERAELFAKTFDVWKAGMDQTDDMTLINVILK